MADARTPRTAVLVVAMLALAGVTLPPQVALGSARASGGGPAEATGHMTLSVARSAYADVRITRDVRLSFNYWSRKKLPTPRFSPGDEFAALVIASRDLIGVTYDAYRLPKEKAVVQRHVALGGTDLCQLERYCEIPAGDYRVFVVSEVPARVRIELKGLKGRSRLTLENPMVGEISGADGSYYESTMEGPVEAARYGVGFSPNLTGEHNFIFSAFWFRGPYDPAGPPPADKPLVQAGDAGGCSFSGVVTPDRYAPGCPAGDRDGGVSTARFLEHFGYQQWGASGNIRPGPISRGYYAVHTGVKDPGFVGFWLDLDS